MKMYNRIHAVVAVGVIAIVAACATTQLPSDAGSSCSTSLSAAEFNSWFESGAVSPNGVVKPADSVNFPDVPNCSFYKWSEQMFLWLTSPAHGGYGNSGLVMNSPAFFDVSPDDGTGRHFIPHAAGALRAFNVRKPKPGSLGLPVVMQKGTLRLLQVIPPILSPGGRTLVLDGQGNEIEVADVRLDRTQRIALLDAGGREIVAPRALLRSKSATEMRPFDLKLQSLEREDRSIRTELVQKIDFGRRVLLLDLLGNISEPEEGQAGTGGVLVAQNGSLVYYSLTVNNVFALYRTMQGVTVAPGTKFPLTQTDLNAVIAFASANGQPAVVDPQALAVEIKASWVEAAGLPNPDQYIRVTATVPTYDKTNPNDWVPNGTKNTTLAMVGMHIVGSTGSLNPANSNHGHPELLWATFEHVGNAPAASYTYQTGSGGATSVPQDTSGSWVFSASGAAAPFNEMRATIGGPSGDHIVAVSGKTIGPSNILRLRPWGLNGSSAAANAEIISINNTVRSSLDAADIRRNYFHEGTTWTIFGASPNSSNQVGSKFLENATLETFTQGGNCFDCHSSNTTQVSHIFNETKPLF